MARGKKAVSSTTISIAKATEFLSSAKSRDTLSCANIPGFHLIRLTKGGVWRYRYTNELKKRRVATVGSYSTLKPEQAAAKVLFWINNDIDPLAEKSSRHENALIEARQKESRILRRYLDDHYRPHMERSWKPANVETTYGRLSKHFKPLLDRDMSTICRGDIDRWQRDIESQGRKYSTVKRIYGALKTLLRRAVQDGVLELDPLANHRLLEPSLKDQQSATQHTQKSVRRMLSQVEIDCLHQGLRRFSEQIRQKRRNSRRHGKPNLIDLDKVNFPHWFIPFCHLALHTGLRPGDLYSLTWEDLNLTFGRLTKICEKTKHAIRRERKPAVVDMKLNPTIKDIMKKWHKDLGKPVSGYVFPSPKTGKQLDVTALNKPWKAIKKLGQLPSNLTFYSLRHNFISALLAKGIPIFTVAKLAGHKSTQMIEEHYGHLCPDQATIAIDIIGSSVSSTTSNRNINI